MPIRVDSEILARQRFVEKLRSDAETYQQLVDLNQPQVEAIVSQLQHVIDASSTQTNRAFPNMRKAVWDRARERSDEDLADITPHDLRHMCASLMRAADADVKAIQQQLGHRNATVTLNTYTHLFEGDLAEVMDRLNAHSATESRPERILGDIVDLPKRSQNPR